MIEDVIEKVEEYAPYIIVGAAAGMLLKKIVDEIKEEGFELNLDDIASKLKLSRIVDK